MDSAFAEKHPNLNVGVTVAKADELKSNLEQMYILR
jgi:hypothetical protein